MENKTKRANVFSSNLTMLRKNKNLSQLELSKLLGTEEIAIDSWEKGISEPNIDMLVKISELFNISLDLILNNLVFSERKNSLNNKAQIPYLRFFNDLLIDVNYEFENLLNYKKHELIGKSIYEVSRKLKIDSQINLKDITSYKDAYVFSKDSQPREVVITLIEKSENERVFYIEEKVYSRLENNMSFIYNILSQDKMAVSVYSYPEGLLLMANEKFFNFYNIAYKDYTLNYGESVKDVLKNCVDNAFAFNILKAMETGRESFKNDICYKISDQSYYYWDSYMVPVYIKGKIKYLVHMAYNVTEKVTYKNIIEKQNQTLEAIIENISDELIIFNKNKEFINVNKLARERFSHTIDKNSKMDDICKGMEVYDYSGNIISKENRLYNRVLNGQKIINEKYILKKDSVSKIKEISGIPLYDDNGSFLAGVLVFHDITEKLIFEENLHIKTQYETLTKIVNNLDLCFERFSYPNLDAIEINNKAFDLLKNFNSNITSYSSIKGMKLFDVMHVKKSVLEKIFNSFEKLDIYQDICQYDINGNEVYYKYIYQPLYGLNNKIVEIIVIGLDITIDIKNKKKMKKALKIQDEIYSNVSHELKTPLSVIFSANQMLDIYLKNNSSENNDKLLSYNNIIKQNCYRLTRLINNIIDISKSGSGNFVLNLSNENIVSIVENIVQSVTEYVKSKDLRIIFETNVDEKIIACDPLQLERIMLNLISNAIKFSNPKSVILVKVIDMVNNVEISVKDEGVGIGQEHLANIFQRYYQVNKSLNRNAEGSGIGLSLTKSIVELHGGKIYVTSKVNCGSTFIIELPSKIIDKESESIKRYTDSKVEMIKVEFSDIYSI